MQDALWDVSKRDSRQYSDGPERLLLYYNKRGPIANPGFTEWLLGKRALAKLLAGTR